MMIKEMKMENILTGEFAALYEATRKNREAKVAEQTKEDQELTQQLLAELDEIEALQASKEEIVDDFIADLESFVEEAKELHTQELLRIQEEQKFERERNLEALDLILSEEIINEYGNKTIKRHRELESKLNQIRTNSDKSIIEIAMSAYGCSYSQAISKLAVRLNINYDHETWFKNQKEIIEHNKKLLENPMVIVIKHPQLWNKLKQNAHMRKYFEFLINLFQTQLEHNGLSYKAISKPLIASASCGFVAESLNIKSRKTAFINMNNLVMFGAAKKLTDKEVKNVDKSRYDSIIELSKNNPFSTEDKDVTTITTYELLLWDDEVLEAMNDMVIEKQRTRSTREGQCHASLDAIGCGDVINKSTKELSKEDKANIASLTKWARKKVFEKGGCGFITREDWESRFNNPENKNTIWAGEHTRDMYETIVMNKLGLSYEYVSKELKSLVNSKKLNNIKRGKVWVPAEIANQLNKYND